MMPSSLRIFFASAVLLLTVLSAHAAAAITSVTVSEIAIDNYRYGGTTAKLRVYSSDSFFNGGVFVAGSAPRSGTWYKQVDCTVAGAVVTVPAFSLVVTTTAADNKNARYTFVWVDSRGVERDVYLSGISVPDTLGSSVTWEQLQVYNRGVGKPNNPTFPNMSQVAALITQTADGIFTETPAGAVNGINQTFTLSRTPVAGSVQLFLNGNLQKQGSCTPSTECYTISGATITHVLPPQTGDALVANYRTASGLVGNGTIPTQIQEGGGIVLSIAAIGDGLCLQRSGTAIVGGGCSGGAGGGGLTDPGANGIIKRIAPGTTAVAVAGTDYLAPNGDASSLTNLNASSLGTGTVPDARFPGTLPPAIGANLTNLNASNLATGTVAPARLGSGTADSTTLLYGDNVWRPLAAAGSDNQVLFNDSNTIGADADFTWNKNTNTALFGTAGGTLTSGGSLILNPAANITLDAVGNQIDPATNYDQNLGQPSKKFLTLHAAELVAETLVSQNTLATIGGRVLVAPSTPLIADLGPAAVQIDVKYSNLANGDRVYLESGGNVEFLAITSSGTPITGGYRYSVTRNLDGTGANQWYAGDAVVNTGQAGSGFIDLYSVAGVKSTSQVGPTIVGNVRNSSTFNDWSETWATGNLNGLYGYGANTYGVAFGKYAAGTPHITIDATNGYRVFSGLSTVVGQWDNSGNVTVGQVASGQSNVFISSGAVALRNNTTDRIKLNSDGSGFLANGNITWNTSGALNISGNATIANWTVNTNAVSSGTTYIASNFDIPAGQVAWFGKTTGTTQGLVLRDASDRSLSLQVGNGSIYPFLQIYDGTRARVILGGLNNTWCSDGSTNSMGLKICDSSGNLLVHFSDVANIIGGWTISNSKISSTGIDIVSGANAYQAFGSTPPSSASSGTGLFLDRTGLYGLLSNVVQAKLDATTGAISAGAGNVKLDSSGVTITAGVGAANKITWKSGSNAVATIYDDGSDTLGIGSQAFSSANEARTEISALNSDGFGTFLTVRAHGSTACCGQANTAYITMAPLGVNFNGLTVGNSGRPVGAGIDVWGRGTAGNVITDMLVLRNDHSSTSAPGLGAGINFKLETTTEDDIGKDAARVSAVWTTATDASRTAVITFQTVTSAAALTEVARIGQGLQMGSPTGGDKGSGTINVAGDIYKNNTAYTNPDYVVERWATGNIVKFADKTGALNYAGPMPLDDLREFMRTNHHLPRFGQDAKHGLFSGGDAMLASLEEAYIYIFQLEERIKRLEVKQQ